MSGLPEGYGYKDLTSLGKAWHKNEILQKKLDVAIKAFDMMNNHTVTRYYLDWEKAYDEVLDIMYKARAKIEKIR